MPAADTRQTGSALRVLHVAERIKGGIASYIDEVTAYQEAHFGSGSVGLIVPASEACYLERPGAARLSTYRFDGRGPLAMLRLFRTVRREIRSFRPDVVHLHSSFAGVSGRLAILTCRPRPAVAYCAHGWSFAIETARWKRGLYAGVERVLARMTDVIINISVADNRDSMAAGIGADKCVVVPNGILPMAQPTDGSSAKSRPGDPLRLLFVGRFDRQKGIDLLLDALGMLSRRDLHLTVIGSPVLGGAEVAMPDSVSVVGWLPRHELPGYYASADAVVMPSRWEGFGMVAIEAMSCGTPVIASNRGALPEIVRHGRTGFVFDLDRDELRSMGVQARRDFERRFTAESMNRRLGRIYRWLAGQLTREEALAQPAGPDHGPASGGGPAGSERPDRPATGTGG
jgi:glycosyltransferase involved in cell wall biosynthesis